MLQLRIKKFFSMALCVSSLIIHSNLFSADKGQPSLDAPLGTTAGALRNTAVIINSTADIGTGLLKLAAVSSAVYISYKTYQGIKNGTLPTSLSSCVKFFGRLRGEDKDSSAAELQKLSETTLQLLENLQNQKMQLSLVGDQTQRLVTVAQNTSNGMYAFSDHLQKLTSSNVALLSEASLTRTAAHELANTTQECFSTIEQGASMYRAQRHKNKTVNLRLNSQKNP